MGKLLTSCCDQIAVQAFQKKYVAFPYISTQVDASVKVITL